CHESHVTCCQVGVRSTVVWHLPSHHPTYQFPSRQRWLLRLCLCEYLCLVPWQNRLPLVMLHPFPCPFCSSCMYTLRYSVEVKYMASLRVTV
ncbi:hypothetical protein BJV78DRAFT_1235430, partial [Lactifluus subvellereus]